MRYWLVYLAILVYGLSLLGAIAAPPKASGNPAAADAAPAQAPAEHVAAPEAETEPDAPPAASNDPAHIPPAPPQPIIGFAVNFHHTDHIELYYKAIDEMAHMGFNTLEVLTPAFQKDGAAEDIEVEVGPGKSPRREDLVKLLKYARKHGMATKLMPLVLFTTPRGNEWRGKIHPEHWDTWWLSYSKMIDHFVDVANECDVSIFSVGSELLTTELDQTARWEKLIAHVRTRYRGRLSYSTNWDHYFKATFWHDLDMIGINGYWDITTLAKSDPPETQALVKRWKEIRKEVLDFGAAQGKPVLLTEIGYPSLPWALKDPWNYVNTTDADSDPKAQAAGISAFLTAWKDVLAKPDPKQFVGVNFFEWDVYHEGGKTDTGYGIRGKAAYELLQKWLAARQQAHH